MPVGVPREDAVPAPPRASVPQQSDGSHERAGGSAKGPLTLLVIEDSRAGGRSVLEILDAGGGYLPGDVHSEASGRRMRVRTARNLTEAERLLTDDVQCILLDLALTGTGGTQATGGTGTTGSPPAPVAAAQAPGGPGGAASGAGSSGPGSQGAGSGPAAGATDASDGSGAATGELEILRHVLRLAPRHAVLALTDGADAERAAEAVRVGAQDYLFRDELDGRLLNRAIRYAVERKRSDLAQRQLTESRLRAQENARLERGLLPTPLLSGSELRFAARYRPGRSRALLGGDFYDTVRTADGTVHAMIGDVCGHGPDEAALGVELRIAWRALTFAGLCGDELLGTLQKVLDNERANDEIFATLCTVDISPDGRRAGVCLAGHPSPLVAGAGGSAPRLLPYDCSGPALGVVPNARWPRRQVELGGSWSLLMYTDGLIEGRVGEGRQRLGQDGMIEIVTGRMAQGADGERLLDATMEDVRRLNGGELTDDVAVLLLDRR
ncbi:PP2C family protein-serine/threonine phosphatase [Streptomyces sp. WMMB 322]|uniref:PP2C family protein-serine/threonine phosphatase n=1 Tax=Streptomyces sp. WMMB 322 TaxID=1286821 RepID=UPI0006E3FCDF|nr:PP2C family protein-serine/threonine phosphatase [Streptomyces sp. WMMB 322]SCK05011.1 Serine phosphatase RsbU, regulator of sigma subunit [Streptomyces sp. WMMB 322]